MCCIFYLNSSSSRVYASSPQHLAWSDFVSKQHFKQRNQVEQIRSTIYYWVLVVYNKMHSNRSYTFDKSVYKIFRFFPDNNNGENEKKKRKTKLKWVYKISLKTASLIKAKINSHEHHSNLPLPGNNSNNKNMKSLQSQCRMLPRSCCI